MRAWLDWQKTSKSQVYDLSPKIALHHCFRVVMWPACDSPTTAGQDRVRSLDVAQTSAPSFESRRLSQVFEFRNPFPFRGLRRSSVEMHLLYFEIVCRMAMQSRSRCLSPTDSRKSTWKPSWAAKPPPTCPRRALRPQNHHLGPPLPRRIHQSVGDLTTLESQDRILIRGLVRSLQPLTARGHLGSWR